MSDSCNTDNGNSQSDSVADSQTTSSTQRSEAGGMQEDEHLQVERDNQTSSTSMRQVLEPNHPLMKRFQEALKNHLINQKSLLRDEISELREDIAKKKVERTHLGDSLYGRQLEINRQQHLIDNCHESLISFVALRQEVESKLCDLKKEQKKELEKQNASEKRESELRSELESLTLLEHQFTKWENQMESELSVSQRVSEKNKVDKKRLANEKRNQDLFIYKLMVEVSKLQNKIKLFEKEQETREYERAALSQTVADASADLQALNKEQHRLLQSWNEVLLSLKKKDNVFILMQQELEKAKNELLTLDSEIKSFEHESAQEMKQNEKLSLILHRHDLEISNLNNTIDKECHKSVQLDARLSELQNMLELTESNLTQARIVYTKLSHENEVIQSELDKLTIEKLSLEKNILDKIQEHMIQDKTARHLNKSVLNVRDQMKNKEIILITTENNLSKANLHMEKQKSINMRNSILIDEMEKELVAQEREVNATDYELERTKSLVNRKEGLVQSLTRRLDAITSKVGCDDKSPQELRIISLKKNIEEATRNYKNMQDKWLRKQRNIVVMSQQRNDQLNDIDILRKKILILEQKNLKIEYNIEIQRKQEENVSSSIKKLLQKILNLNTNLSGRHGHKYSLDKENTVLQNLYTNTLKIIEEETAKLERDVKDQEKENDELGKKLLDIQREHLAWERKVQMVSDTKKRMDKERMREGEIGAMKSEIHRMKVRYSELCKTQEKLVLDLEHCVTRRDAVLTGAEARDKKGTKLTRYKFQKKIEDLKNNIKEKNKEIKSLEKQIATTDVKKQIEDSITDKEVKMSHLKTQISNSKKKLEDGWFLKQKNLELLVLHQKKLKMYEDVKKGRHKPLFKNEIALEEENKNQKIACSQLISILESLILDFPALHIKLNKILYHLNY